MKRRTFVKNSGLALAGASLLGLSTSSCQPLNKPTIQEVIDLIMAAIPGERRKDSVDTIKSGDASQPVTGVVSTFLATAAVIQKAADQGANFIITHEPTFYNHLDDTDWLKDDPVYRFKRELLEKHNIVVWRFHDYWHQHRPDGILHGFLKTVGWMEYEDKTRENIAVIPPMSLPDLASFFKSTLKLSRTFYVGNPEQECKQIGLLLGAWGSPRHMAFFQQEDIDTLVIGECNEWETCEYSRDAAFAGLKKGLIILGHAGSEEPGMEYLVEWLQPRIPDVPVIHVPATDPFVPV